MLQNRFMPKGTLLIAGLAAYAYYKYSKMSEEQKKSLVSDLKEKGKKLYEDYVPEDLKKTFSNVTGNMGGASSKFGEGNSYTG